MLVCDGAILAVGRDPTQAGEISAVTPQTITSGAGDDSAAPVESQLDAPTLSGGEGPAVFTAEPQGRTRVDVTATGSAAVSAEDIAGFTASACRPPLQESWLVGGSGATGAADIVVLSNPGAVPATVQLTTYGATGAQTPPGGQLVLPPGTQEFVPLSGLVLGESAPVIRVTAVGAPVHASLQASVTRTLTPGGVDQIGATVAPEPSATIAGVTVTANPGTTGASNATTVLRILAPSDAATATVTVTEVGAAAPAAAPQQVALVAGQPAEVELGGLPIGTYDVQVTADHPVVSAVWQTTGFGEGIRLRLVHGVPARHGAESLRDAVRAAACAEPGQRRR